MIGIGTLEIGRGPVSGMYQGRQNGLLTISAHRRRTAMAGRWPEDGIGMTLITLRFIGGMGMAG